MKLIYLALLGYIVKVQGHKLNQRSLIMNKVQDTFENQAKIKKHHHRKTYSIAQKKGGRSRSGSGSSDKNDDMSFGMFILGCFLIGLALPMVWMNERKQVKIFKLIEKARKSAIPDAPSGEVSQNDNFKLVHTSATTTTQEPT